jgi:hypothetical protein
MKTSKILFTAFVVICLVILFKCGGSGSGSSIPRIDGDNVTMTSDGSGVTRDNNTELVTGFQGLVVEDIYIVDGNDKRIDGTTVGLNTKFSVIYEGVKNYTLKDGKAFPDLSIVVTDASQNPVLNETDLLASYTDGLSEEDASVLRASVTVGHPMERGEYICSIHIVDKNNSNAAIVSTWSFDVK